MERDHELIIVIDNRDTEWIEMWKGIKAIDQVAENVETTAAREMLLEEKRTLCMELIDYIVAIK